MIARIEKRNGAKVQYQPSQILRAIQGANEDLGGKGATTAEVAVIYEATRTEVEKILNGSDRNVTVDEINDIVETKMMQYGCHALAKQFIEYRYQHKIVRESNTTDLSIKELISGESEYWKAENSNKNATLVTTQRDYIAGITSTDISRRFLLPKDVVKAHDEGIIHFHDIDYFAENARTNCCLVNLEDMLQNGTVLNGVMIEKPHRFLTACTITTQIITAVSSSQYGGVTISLTHLAPFVRSSYEKFLSKYTENGIDAKTAKKLATLDTKKEVADGVQTFNYQVNSMSSTNGQAPFISVCMFLDETEEYRDELALIIEEFLKQRIVGLKNEQGLYVTQAFPKLLYVLDEDNVSKGSKYYYLTELAAECTAKRMVPDYISAKKMREYKIDQYGKGDVYPCMGCRSFLTPDRIKGNPAHALNYREGEGKYYGRFNIGVVSVNLPDIALSADGDEEKFWTLFDERTELCHKALQCRIKRLENVTSDVAPILWQYGAFARLPKHAPIKSLLYGGYATASLGFVGLYECVKAFTGKSLTEPEGRKFGLEVMQALNDRCTEWKEEEDIDYSLYGTPAESLCYKFAKSLKKRFGDDVFIKMDGKDRNYLTNSYHVPVFQEIDAFTKLTKESEFQRLAPGGAISYVEIPNMVNNISAVLAIIKHIYNTIMYAELNTRNDICEVCGYEGEIQAVDQADYNGSLPHQIVWRCPQCGNMDAGKMSVPRRVCGYINANNLTNAGKMNEYQDRVLHL